MEMRAVQGAQDALKELAKLLPDTAEVIAGNTTRTVPIGQLKVGDVILAKPGGKIAADGSIIEGESEVNESMVTGESKPVVKGAGAQVIAGTINGYGSLRIKVGKIGENTFLSGVMKLVAQAQSSKSKLQMLSDQAAFYLTVIALVSGALTFIVWMLNRSGANFALERTVAVLVVACPHALGLAIPLVASISTNMAAKNGLLVKQRLALEAARNIDVVVFDKTGTLTQGKPDVTDIIPLQGKTNREILMIAASLEIGSEHSLAETVVEVARRENLDLVGIEGFHAIPGHGVEGIFNRQRVTLGNRSLMLKDKIDLAVVEPQIAYLENQGKTVMILAMNGKPAGLIAVSDLVKDSAKSGIIELHNLGIETIMISGDNQRTARAVADQLGIDRVLAEVLPGQKEAEVRKIQAQNKVVAMVGDGINDAPALAAADVGLAMGSGTDVAIEASDITLINKNLNSVASAIKLSRKTMRVIKQNLFWAFGYNVILIPIAMGILYPFFHITLNPIFASAAMALSSISVVINSLRLRGIKI
jgi:Cu+-exporting ATPase